jgi:hypothetical protein
MAELNIENNSEYDAYSKRWATIRAINDGEPKLKQLDLANVNSLNSASIGALTSSSADVRVSFLRPINPTNRSNYNIQRNINMINGARLYNATVKTRSGLMGMLYRKPPVESDLPGSIDYIFDNVNGSGLSMIQQSRSVSSDIVSIGRDGLLVDMPRNDEGAQITQADVTNGFRASIQEYKAESIVDWHESIINNVKVLDLLILCEVVEVRVEGSINGRQGQNRYKVYRLNNEGVTVQIFTQKTGKDNKGLEESGAVAVLGPNSLKLTEIPFTFIGSKNNQPSVDDLPLEPIALINIGHYQESANLASSSFQLSACQPWVADKNYSKIAQDKAKNGGSVELGEDSLIVLDTGGTFNFASPPPNPLSKSIQDGYKDQMVELGAQIITPNGMAETAEAAKLKHASNVSDLGVISDNVSDGYTNSIRFVCFFMGVEYKEEYNFRLNSEFFDMSLSAEDAVKWVSVWQGAAINKDVLDTILVKGKAIAADVDLDAMNQAIQDEQGSSVDFDGNEE